MRITTFSAGQTYWQASLLFRGREEDDGTGDAFTTRREAEAEGRVMVRAADPVHTPRDDYSFTVRRYEVIEVGEDGTFGSAVSID